MSSIDRTSLEDLLALADTAVELFDEYGDANDILSANQKRLLRLRSCELADESWYVLIAEGGGWPTHAIGPFPDHDAAERHMLADKWRESWGSVASDPRDLRIIDPEEEQR